MHNKESLTFVIFVAAALAWASTMTFGQAAQTQPACSHAAMTSSSSARGKCSIGNWVLVTEHAAFSPRDTGEGTVFAGKMWMSNGWAAKPDNKLEGSNSRDLWNSTDGVTWTLVTDNTPYDLYSEMVVFNNKLWAVSGSVWNSDDGIRWNKVLDKTPFGPRGYGELVVLKDKMWQLGSGDDVWSSADGINWTCVANKVPYGDRAATAVAAFDGKLWVMAGRIEATNTPPEKTYKQYLTYNDAWCSEDGIKWTRTTESAPWAPRMWSVAIVYDERLWIIGGFDNRNRRNLGDVWSTTDGQKWERLETKTQFTPRHEVTPYVYKDSLWVVAGNIWPVVNDVWRLTLPTKTAKVNE